MARSNEELKDDLVKETLEKEIAAEILARLKIEKEIRDLDTGD